MRKLHHIGIITSEKKEGAMFNKELRCWGTDISKSPNKIEYLKFESDTCMPKLVISQSHLAYEVPSLEEALKGAKLIFGPHVCNENLTIAFIEEEGISIELMEFKA